MDGDGSSNGFVSVLHAKLCWIVHGMYVMHVEGETPIQMDQALGRLCTAHFVETPSLDRYIYMYMYI